MGFCRPPFFFPPPGWQPSGAAPCGGPDWTGRRESERGSALWRPRAARTGRLPGVHCAGGAGLTRGGGGGGGGSPKVTGAGLGQPRRGSLPCFPRHRGVRGGGSFSVGLRLGRLGPGANGASRPRRLRGCPGGSEGDRDGGQGTGGISRGWCFWLWLG